MVSATNTIASPAPPAGSNQLQAPVGSGLNAHPISGPSQRSASSMTLPARHHQSPPPEDGTQRLRSDVEDNAPPHCIAAALCLTALPAVAPSIWRAHPTSQNPYGEVASLSAEQALPCKTTSRLNISMCMESKLGHDEHQSLPPVILTCRTGRLLGVTPPIRNNWTPTFSLSALSTLRTPSQFANSRTQLTTEPTITLNRPVYR